MFPLFHNQALYQLRYAKFCPCPLVKLHITFIAYFRLLPLGQNVISTLYTSAMEIMIIHPSSGTKYDKPTDIAWFGFLAVLTCRWHYEIFIMGSILKQVENNCIVLNFNCSSQAKFCYLMINRCFTIWYIKKVLYYSIFFKFGNINLEPLIKIVLCIHQLIVYWSHLGCSSITK